MASTPKKLVHWALDVSLSEFGSPLSDASSNSVASTSSLQFINSQLVAHGFASAPGLCFDGLSNADGDRIIKCLLSMLTQRVEDMSRTEDLTTKLRTLAYDHDRLMSLQRTLTEKAANAEREMNLHKCRLAAAQRSLQATENAHKNTTAELQRTRVSLQTVRSAHQSELKKKEKEVERIFEKWSKLSDMQAKVAVINSGMSCINAGVVEGSEMLGKGNGFIEVALEQAEQARGLLSDENANLRRSVLTAVNEAQSVLHLIRSLHSDSEEEPTPLTLTTLFPLSPRQAAHEKLTSVLTALHQSVSLISSSIPTSSTQSSSPPPKSTIPDGELERLQTIINSLRIEIEQAQKQSTAQATHTQALFDQFAEDQRAINEVGEMSLELMTAPARDEERERLEEIKRQLDEERRKFTEAAIRLGREKAALEAERIKFLDEKRSWQVDLMLAELPPTPNPASPRISGKPKSPRKSPRKSPLKMTKVSRRHSLAYPSKVVPSFETEVMPPLPALPIFAKARTSLLPTSFVLPPPSPLSSFPARPALLSAAISDAVPPSSTETTSSPSDPILAPSTPPGLGRPFPTAKPFASRMIHAYSPAKPSPLSRILMLGNSPPTFGHPDPGSNPYAASPTPLEMLVEEDEDQESEMKAPGVIPALFSTAPNCAGKNENESEGEGGRESPLQEKKVESNVFAKTAKGRVLHHPRETKRFTTLEKGKGKAEVVVVATTTRPRGAVSEKENDAKATNGSSTISRTSSSKLSSGTSGSVDVKSGGRVVSRARLMAKVPLGKVGGARRVPVDSAEAGLSSGRGWRG